MAQTSMVQEVGRLWVQTRCTGG